MRTAFSYNDFLQTSINRQRTYRGTSFTEVDPKKVYFLLYASGANITVKDANDVIVDITGTLQFVHPIRLDGGIKISSTSACTVIFCDATLM